jgi:hypothetical protein
VRVCPCLFVPDTAALAHPALVDPLTYATHISPQTILTEHIMKLKNCGMQFQHGYAIPSPESISTHRMLPAFPSLQVPETNAIHAP